MEKDETGKQTAEIRGNVLVIGPNTERFISEQERRYPRLREQMPEIGFRFDCRNVEKHSRSVLFFPGIWRTEADEKKSTGELSLWNWVGELPEARSQIQVLYPKHSFVAGLLVAQCEDLLGQHNNIKQLDLVGLSFGNFWLVPLIADMQAKGLPIEIRSIVMEMPGTTKKDLTILANTASKLMEWSRKAAVRAGVLSTISPHKSALAVRASAIPKGLPVDKSPFSDIRVLAILASRDELMDPVKSEKSIKGLFPRTEVVRVDGGHFWDRERMEAVREMTVDFWNRE